MTVDLAAKEKTRWNAALTMRVDTLWSGALYCAGALCAANDILSCAKAARYMSKRAKATF